MNTLENNFKIVNEKIAAAAKKSGRSKDDILLLAVSKTVDIDTVEQAIALGQTSFGENRVQEFNRKYEVIGDKADWHIIGRLQSNKVKYIIGKVKLIHSLDSLKLAQEINERSMKMDVVTDALVEINAAKELSKGGIYIENAADFIQKLSVFDNIRIKGLMTVAPFDENPQNNRKYFAQMKNLFVDIKDKNIDNINMSFLSMGMTNDYEVAIEEGSNIVRIGTGLFGERNYSILK